MMTRPKAVGMAFASALVGSLLAGCTSANLSAVTSSPPATDQSPDPLVAEWSGRDGPAYACLGGDSWPRTFLALTADGRWVLPYCDNGGTYEVSGTTITYLGGDRCDDGAQGVYTYTLAGDELTQQVTADPCRPRRRAFDGVTFVRMPGSTAP